MNSRGLARLLSYWNRRAGGLPGVTRGCCSRLDVKVAISNTPRTVKTLLRILVSQKKNLSKDGRFLSQRKP